MRDPSISKSPVTPARQILASTQRHVSPGGPLRHASVSPVSSGALLFHEAASVRKGSSPGLKRQQLDENRNDLAQRLLEASMRGDDSAVESELAAAQKADINHPGTVSLRVRYSELVPHHDEPLELVIKQRELKTDVTALFAACHGGHLAATAKLLAAGAEPNQKVFCGYPTTAAAREGHSEPLTLLLSQPGLCQDAVRQAFLEACLYGEVEAARALLASGRLVKKEEELAQALTQAAYRGLLPMVQLLLQEGAPVSCQQRILVQCSRPALHLNATCTPLMAATVARHVQVVEHLLQSGASPSIPASLGAWSWDQNSAEELRVGAGLAEPYSAAWAAVEYARGPAGAAVLARLVQHIDTNQLLEGRSMLHHAILCRNAAAAEVLLEAGVDRKLRVRTQEGQEFCPLHMAARIGDTSVMTALLDADCEVDAIDHNGYTPCMLALEHGNLECVRHLVAAGAKLDLKNGSGFTLLELAARKGLTDTLQSLLSEARRQVPKQPKRLLHEAAMVGDAAAIQALLQKKGSRVDERDKKGNTAAILGARNGHLEALRVLVLAGANVSLVDKTGQGVLSLADTGAHASGIRQVLLHAIEHSSLNTGGRAFYPLHFAVSMGALGVARLLLKRGISVDAEDDRDCTPLMVTAREGQAEACELLLTAGADVDRVGPKGETALDMARRSSKGSAVEACLLNHLARNLVLQGGMVVKHTRLGRGKPHSKHARVDQLGVFTWGEGRKRTLSAVVAELGGGGLLEKNRPREGKEFLSRSFRIEGRKGRTVLFQAASEEEALLWVRGVNLVAAEAVESFSRVKKGVRD